MKGIEEEDLFRILLKNDHKELKDFLLSKGKGPKTICPIIFISKGENNETDNE